MIATCLKAPALDVYGQMALDDAVFSMAPPEALILRFYEWPGGPREPKAPHGLTFGYFQTFEEARRASARCKSDIPLARRLTGGGIVFHDRDVTFSVIFPWHRIASPGLIYKDMHRGIHLGLKSLGLASRLWSPGPAAASAPVECFAGPSPMDLVHEDGRKILGGALRRRRNTGLYQGSFRPEGFGAPADVLRRAIKDGLALEWSASFIPTDIDEDTLSEAERLRSERYATDAWNRKR